MWIDSGVGRCTARPSSVHISCPAASATTLQTPFPWPSSKGWTSTREVFEPRPRLGEVGDLRSPCFTRLTASCITDGDIGACRWPSQATSGRGDSGVFCRIELVVRSSSMAHLISSILSLPSPLRSHAVSAPPPLREFALSSARSCSLSTRCEACVKQAPSGSGILRRYG